MDQQEDDNVEATPNHDRRRSRLYSPAINIPPLQLDPQPYIVIEERDERNQHDERFIDLFTAISA